MSAFYAAETSAQPTKSATSIHSEQSEGSGGVTNSLQIKRLRNAT